MILILISFQKNWAVSGVEPSTLRLRGTSNVHIVDASIIPRSPPCHPVAMVMAVGSKAADMLATQVKNFLWNFKLRKYRTELYKIKNEKKPDQKSTNSPTPTSLNPPTTSTTGVITQTRVTNSPTPTSRDTPTPSTLQSTIRSTTNGISSSPAGTSTNSGNSDNSPFGNGAPTVNRGQEQSGAVTVQTISALSVAILMLFFI